MRFLFGLAIGFGVGFAGAILFAPDRSGASGIRWPEGTPEGGPLAVEENGNVMAAVKRSLRSFQRQVNEALDEAKKAQADAEKELRERYEKSLQREKEEETP